MEQRDEKIIKLLFERSESALEQITGLYGRLIKSIAFNLFKSDTAAEECLNDTLLDIWNSIPPEKPRSVASYAAMIARRRTIDRIRGEMAQKRYRPENSEYHSVDEELSFMDDIAGEVVEKMELTEQINRFLGTLSPTNREIFISRFYDFESIDSIAGRLHISKNSVNTRLTRMRNALKEQLEKGGMSV